MDPKQNRKQGRPSREEPRKVVYFKESTFLIWNARKEELSRETHGGCTSLTSDEFAHYLLKNLTGRGDKNYDVQTADHKYCIVDEPRQGPGTFS